MEDESEFSEFMETSVSRKVFESYNSPATNSIGRTFSAVNIFFSHKFKKFWDKLANAILIFESFLRSKNDQRKVENMC